MLDPYYLLGVELNATSDEIRAAYRRKAAEVHPDLQPPEKREWASERMKQLNAARDLLLDPKRRAEYDEHMRLEMAKAKWRARRDAYAYVSPTARTRRRRGGWPVGLLIIGALPLVCSLALLYDPFLVIAFIVAVLAGAAFWLGPLIITLLFIAIVSYWKS